MKYWLKSLIELIPPFRGARGVFPHTSKWLFITLYFSLSACNSESAPDCFQNAGELIREEVAVSDFTKITVFENVGLVLNEGEETKVEVETGEFLRNDVSATVEDGRLVLRDSNNCNYFRAYGTTTIYVTSPNIEEVRSSTGLKIKSDGILNYPSLKLISESFNNPESEITDGTFDLEINTNSLSILVNGITYFNLRGNTNFLDINMASGDSRIEAENLISEVITIDHRGTNDILVHPVESLQGVIRGTGDVISFNQPNVLDVDVLFKGALIFRN